MDYLYFRNTLAHHGIKGQKWGVRRFQNPDGTLTEAGKQRRKDFKYTTNDISGMNEIYRSLSDKEKKFLDPSGVGEYDPETVDYAGLYYSKLLRIKDIPVAYFNVWTDEGNKHGYAEIATNSDPEYRGKGYAKKLAMDGLKYVQSKRELLDLEWTPMSDNAASKALAVKLAFEYMGDDGDMSVYKKAFKMG